MTVRVIQSFDFLPTGLTHAQLETKFGMDKWYFDGYITDFSGMSLVTGANTPFNYGAAMKFNRYTAQYDPRMKIVTPVPEVSTGFIAGRLYAEPDYDAHCGFAFWSSNTFNPHISIVMGRLGRIEVWRGYPPFRDTGTLIGRSKVGVFFTGAWFHLEVKAKIHPTEGSVEVRVNTETVIDLVDVNTSNDPAMPDSYDMIGLVGGLDINTTETVQYERFRLDDFYAYDTMGTVNNDWMGNLRIKAMFPIANGYLNQMDISGLVPAATNWQSVNNRDVNDNQYVLGDPGEQDWYDPDPNLNSPLVRALQARSANMMDDATQRTIRHKVRIGGVDYFFDPTHYLYQSWAYHKSIMELNPATGVGWTGAEVNGAEIGIEVG